MKPLFAGALLALLFSSPAAAVDYYVDARDGKDSYPGTAVQPFRTLTHAVGLAPVNSTIYIRPGTYDTVHGEIFPIALKPGQSLIGDEPNRGAGSTPTTIRGSGPTSPEVIFDRATLLAADGSSVRGLNFADTSYAPTMAAVCVFEASAEVAECTFEPLTYAGVLLQDAGTSHIRRNTFNAEAYGTYVLTCPKAPLVEENEVLETAIPFDVRGSTTNVVFRNNVIHGNGQVGIQVIHGEPQIIGNRFTNLEGYRYAAVRTYHFTARPILRSNTFLCDYAVEILEGTPDLGRVDDPGRNDFSAVSGICIRHAGDQDVPAYGNTWPSGGPAIGDDIVQTGAGVVLVESVATVVSSFGRWKARW